MKPDRPYTTVTGDIFYARTFVLLTVALLGVLLYHILLPFFAPMTWALFIAFLLHPVHNWLAARLRGRASLSAGVLTFATLMILIGPLTALGAAFVAQVADLLRFAQRFAAEYQPVEFADLGTVPVLGPVLAWAQQTMGVSLAQIQGWAIEAARTLLQSLASLGRQLFFGALGTVINFILMMFILFFAIRDGQRIFAVLRGLIPASPENKARLFNHLGAVTRALVFGTGVTALTQGTLIAIGFTLVGLPSPIVFGVLAALFALVPLAGTPVVWVPAVLVLALQQRWGAAIFLLAWGAMVSLIDNVLRPLLVSGRAPVATLTVFIGVLGGVSVFGPIGVFLGPLVLALAIALIEYALDLNGDGGASAAADRNPGP